jgi:3-deoxy-D-manno-octulosonate 8-phosphate phosphatase (KDO 8-P phosphatase)
MTDAFEHAARVRALLFDVDGVLTDGGIYTDEDGRVMKRFDVRDGAGIKLAQAAGFAVGIISGHDSKATHARARALGIEHCYTGVREKAPVLRTMLETLALSCEQILYMGDDYMDLPVLSRAGFAVTVPHAPEIVKAKAHYVTSAAAGRGAVREAIELVLRATGRLEALLDGYRLA